MEGDGEPEKQGLGGTRVWEGSSRSLQEGGAAGPRDLVGHPKDLDRDIPPVLF